MRPATVCICILAVVAIAALLIMLYFTGFSTTGAVSSGICPTGSTPILVEGKGMWLQQVRAFQNRGFTCFWGYDGVTPCCAPQ